MYAILNTVFPIYFLIAAGFAARKLEILKEGDQRVLNSYVYYFSLPLLFFVELSRLTISAHLFKITLVSIIPIIFLFFLIFILYRFFRVDKKALYLFFICSAFGSTALFGIPFIMIAYSGNEAAGRLSVLFAAAIGATSIFLIIYLFESLKKQEKTRELFVRFLRNPLIIAIAMGFLFVVLKINLPEILTNSFSMVGKTTTPVALFMLGVFLSGRRYRFSRLVVFLSFFKVVLFPLLFFLLSGFLSINKMERDIMLLMYATPGALALLVLSQRYGFFVHEIAAFVLLTSITAPFLMKLWLLVI